MSKFCGNCKYVSRPLQSEPCHSCNIKALFDKWQPREKDKLCKFTGPDREARNGHL